MGKKSRAGKSPERVERGNWPAVLACLAFIAVLCLIFFYIWGGRATTGDFEGKIVDRWADYSSTSQGARPFFRLVVESSEGKRFTVKVDPNVYESARVGMKIKGRSGQVVLIDTDETSTTNKSR